MEKNKIVELRRANLKKWFADKTVPTEEKSYVSQLIGGSASFGEKAARRLESVFQMPAGYLISPESKIQEVQTTSKSSDEINIPLFDVSFSMGQGAFQQDYEDIISAIDAPEKAQPFGQRAKQALSDLCYGKPASIVYVDTDHYGRTVADVSCAGVDVGRSMVGSGMAWAYDKYIAGHEYLYPLQDKARHNKTGLWSIDATPPWEWRKTQKIIRLKMV